MPPILDQVLPTTVIFHLIICFVAMVLPHSAGLLIIYRKERQCEIWQTVLREIARFFFAMMLYTSIVENVKREKKKNVMLRMFQIKEYFTFMYILPLCIFY